MTPAARIQAAIEILDRIGAGEPAERALTGWARGSRYAGSKDRAAVRDHVFDALRCRRSFAALGGAETGRGLMIGALRAAGTDVASLFNDLPYGPAALSEAEQTAGAEPTGQAESLDLPDWIWPVFERSLGDAATSAAAVLRSRAPVHLRVNLLKAAVTEAVDVLAQDGIEAIPHPAADTALEVTQGARKIRNSSAYKDGLVELQDAASQGVVCALPLRNGMRVLDYCAGGGGKTLAMAAQASIDLFAHDAAPDRMRDLPARAQRAGAQVRLLDDPKQAAPFDLILCDAPCSGSGSWRRDPEGKWSLSKTQLNRVVEIQRQILDEAAGLLCPGGVLAYATCSMLDVEDTRQTQGFLSRHPGWKLSCEHAWLVHQGTDGFYTAQMIKP